MSLKAKLPVLEVIGIDINLAQIPCKHFFCGQLRICWTGYFLPSTAVEQQALGDHSKITK